MLFSSGIWSLYYLTITFVANSILKKLGFFSSPKVILRLRLFNYIWLKMVSNLDAIQ